MDGNTPGDNGEYETILNKLDEIDNRVNVVKGWVVFIGIVVLLGLIIGILGPVCNAAMRI